MNQSGALALRAGHPTRSGFSAERSAVAPVLIRKHPRTRIVNSWLILIGIVGAIIAVADGLKRPPNSDLEPLPQSLQYDPYSAALLLAGITLPLAFAYARRARASLTEAVFLWFILCTAAYTKDFSYLRLPGVPLFVTDIVLIVLLTSIYIVRRRRGPRVPVVLNISVPLFALAGVLPPPLGFSGLIAHDSWLLASTI